MKIEKTINYTLTIQKGDHKFDYSGSAENDIAGMLICCAVIEGNLDVLKDQKKKSKGKEKQALGAYISKLSQSLAAIQKLTIDTCDSYEQWIKEMPVGK